MKQKYFNTIQKLVKKINSNIIIESKPYFVMDYIGYNNEKNNPFWIFKHYFPGIIRININKKSRYINNIINKIKNILEYYTDYYLLINDEQKVNRIYYTSLTKEKLKDINNKYGIDFFKEKLKEYNADNIIEFINNII